MKLVTVGTGTVSPHAQRRSAAHWIESGDVKLLMDCGAGTCHGLAHAGLPWADITHIAITHFHQDHIGELPALIFAFKYGVEEPRRAPLTILGPAGTRARLDLMAAAFGAWVTDPGFPLDVTDITLGRPALVAAGLSIEAYPVPHTDESVAYGITTRAGRVVYTGDTGPSEGLGDWARGCDLLLAECSLPDERAMAIHLTPSSVGALAHRAQAKRLVLTHLYPPVEGVDIAGIIGRTYRGPVTIARDGDRFTVGE